MTKLLVTSLAAFSEVTIIDEKVLRDLPELKKRLSLILDLELSGEDYPDTNYRELFVRIFLNNGVSIKLYNLLNHPEEGIIPINAMILTNLRTDESYVIDMDDRSGFYPKLEEIVSINGISDSALNVLLTEVGGRIQYEEIHSINTMILESLSILGFKVESFLF